MERNFKDEYKMQGRLGIGGFGDVFKVLNKKNNQLYALKGIPKDPEENVNDFKKQCEKEIEIMKNIKSKYIVKYEDNYYDENYECYYIVMELCDSDLRKLLNKDKQKGLPLELINKIFLQLNDALKAMLEMNCVHRDLKPENILIKYTDKNKTIFDIKLGLSTNDIKSSIKTYSKVGTQNYCAPEIDKFHYNNKCDLWSLGVILYELYTNKYIFDSDNPIETEINRQKGKINNKTDNKLINNLIDKLIVVDIEKRINWEQYFNDEFFKKNDKNENQQIIKIKINVDEDNEYISIYKRNRI